MEKAYREIVACSGTHFDPACVAAFRRNWPAIRMLFAHGAEDERRMAVSNG
ncbi:response regulator RpfG family c-di-GMP phosphodiesterase [Rhizobium sp. BK316]|nr:response regulator RpfG family c-di-GMP phosphodiesterase [Rhizobium sp. BK316]